MSTPSKFLKSLPLSILERKPGVLGASARPTTGRILSRARTDAFDAFAANAAVGEVRAAAIEAPTSDAFLPQPCRGR